jgi:hypothetical protein
LRFFIKLYDRIGISTELNEFVYIFFKSFCKNIRRFENFKLLTTIRRGPRRPSWPTTVSSLTVMGHDGSEVARGPPRAWRSAAMGHGGYRQTVVRYGGKSNCCSPRRYGTSSCHGVRWQVPPPLYMPKISPEIS